MLGMGEKEKDRDEKRDVWDFDEHDLDKFVSMLLRDYQLTLVVSDSLSTVWHRPTRLGKKIRAT
jgi:hypothetical protein